MFFYYNKPAALPGGGVFFSQSLHVLFVHIPLSGLREYAGEISLLHAICVDVE